MLRTDLYCSFCRKTTLTKHARSAHRMSSDAQYTEDDASESESEASPTAGRPQSSNYYMAHWGISDQGMPRSYHRQQSTPIQRPESTMQVFKTEGTPFSPQVGQVPPIVNTYSHPYEYQRHNMVHVQETSHGIDHRSPTSQVYQVDTTTPELCGPRSIPAEYNAVNMIQQYSSGNQTMSNSTTPTQTQLLAPGQTLDSSPGSMSEGSSQPDSAQTQDVYYSHVQPQNYQIPAPQMVQNGVMQYPQYQAVTTPHVCHQVQCMMPPQPAQISSQQQQQQQQQRYTHAPTAQPQSQPQPQPAAPPPQQQQQQRAQPAPQAWYDSLPYEPPMMISAPQPMIQSRLYTPSAGLQDWYMKPEDVGVLLPSQRVAESWS
ncbi:Serine/threonine-protein kinase wnk3 [Hypocenomyce scalaris]|nr:Serine/threonine-protein kinase wnk3 [Hypocenomyce scalaris]